MEQKSTFDRTQLIGLLLIGVVFAYFSFNSTTDPAQGDDIAAPTEEVQSEQSESPAAIAVVDTPTTTNDTLREEGFVEEFFEIENEVLRMVVSNIGAQVVEVELKEYQTWDSLPLYLANQNQTMNYQLGNWNSSAANYEVGERTATSLALTTQGPDGPITFRWALKGAREYQTDFKISGKVNSPQELTLNWDQKTIKHEKSRRLENEKTRIAYWEIEDGEMENLSSTGSDDETVSNIRWLAHQEQFFSSILTAEGRFDGATMRSRAFEDGDYIKEFESEISIQDVNGDFAVNMNMYYGPNKYDILKQYDLGYGKIIDFGWGIFGWISRGVVVKIFNWLDSYHLNYGLIILLMALLIKTVLAPFTFQSYKSMAKMRVLKPEIDELNEKHKDDDPMKKQQATMELYRKAGVNPLGGCIPQLLQLPILFAMFRFFPASIELRQESFWWATDLSTYDVIATLPFEIPFYGSHVSLFTILMAISTFIYSYMNQQMTGSANSQMPQLKYIIYFMPFMLLFFFNQYPAALSYYYMVSNLITFGQQYAIRRFIDEDALHAKLQANKAKPKKQSKLSKRLSAAMEQQQELNESGNRRMRRMNK